MQMRPYEHISYPQVWESLLTAGVALNHMKQGKLYVSSCPCVKFEALASGVKKRHDLIIPQPR